ncbi:MAG TPA: nitrilase-related carbon-nitrogen hydrolase, partial [Paludibacter sp.]|nr:nitrilase-related carbon-nitrogen hydrolase [Paludibacter sp.]
WADVEANLQKVDEQLAQLSGHTDLVVLPEMFTTGFCTDKLHLAEPMDGHTVKTLRSWAQKYQLAITGSFMAAENRKVYNRAFFVFPSGHVETADKRHLFNPGDENLHFTRGDKRLVVKYCDFSICVLVCYDIRFPVWSRNVDNEYDLLVYVANFPQRRIRDWDILLQARAIENQAYVCGVNRVGVDALGIEYDGHSALLDFKANSLLPFHENKTSVYTAEILPKPLKVYREKFPVWKDADKFQIK